MPELKNGNKYVSWKVFLGLASIVILVVGGAVTISINAFKKANANELEVREVKITEGLHYEEIQKSLIRIEKALNIK